METLLTLVGGVVFGAFSSWYISHRYYLKSSAEQKAELHRLSRELRPRTTLQDFEQLLEASAWRKAVVNHAEVWVCETDNTFQVEQGDRSREFVERWTSVHPDVNSSAYPVHLKIGGVIVKELNFVSMDGGRIFVPMPEIRPIDGGVEYFWNLGSLEVKVCRVIGSYYIYRDLEGVAQRSGIAVVE